LKLISDIALPFWDPESLRFPVKGPMVVTLSQRPSRATEQWRLDSGGPKAMLSLEKLKTKVNS